MPDTKSSSARYRRLAQECLEVAYTFQEGVRRTVLLQMAQVWQRLADDYADAPMSLFPMEGERPAMQQQQQIQPDDHKKE